MTTWFVFIAIAIGSFIVDHVAHRDNHKITLKEASVWSVFWVLIAMAFAGYLYVFETPDTASLFITGYALEKALSVDNLFVIMAVFTYFNIPDHYRHRVLHWGIIGAVVFRGIFVALATVLYMGAETIDKANGIAYVELVFAAIIFGTAILMMKGGDDEESDPTDNGAVRFAKKIWPMHDKIESEKFFVIKNGIRHMTPLFLCLVAIEAADVMFAADSVPAVLAVARDPLIVYSAMMFAIMGLRALYFVLEALKDMLCHLEKAVIALLFFIGAKLTVNSTYYIFDHGFYIEPNVSLIVVLSTLAAGVLASVMFPQKED